MSYIANDPASYEGEAVGTGQCVAFVRDAASMPSTSNWREGVKVRDGKIAAGTIIATFQGGKYKNTTDGSSHAAVFVQQSAGGLEVWDQWVGHPVGKRTIRFQGGHGKPVNDGDAYSVVE